MNDIAQATSNAHFIMYADDTNILPSGNNFSAVLEGAGSAVTTVRNCMDVSKLTLIAGKSQYIIFHKEQTKTPRVPSKIAVSATQIQRVDSTKN